jgi:hypothetical protein
MGSQTTPEGGRQVRCVPLASRCTACPVVVSAKLMVAYSKFQLACSRLLQVSEVSPLRPHPSHLSCWLSAVDVAGWVKGPYNSPLCCTDCRCSSLGFVTPREVDELDLRNTVVSAGGSSTGARFGIVSVELSGFPRAMYAAGWGGGRMG